jgi:hypothetical protein
MNESFVYYKSFYEATEGLTDEQFGKVMRTLAKYALTGEEARDMDAITKLAFTLMKPQVDANERRRKNGNNGGRPITEPKPNNNLTVTEPEPKRNLTVTEPEPNVNVNVNANVNANANKNANVNPNENVNVNVSPSGEKEKTDSNESVQKKRFTIEDALIGLGFSAELETALKEWCSYKSERHENYKELGLKNLVTQVSNNAKQYGDLAVIRAVRDSMASGYKGIMFDRLRAAPKTGLTHDEFVDQWRNV